MSGLVDEMPTNEANQSLAPPFLHSGQVMPGLFGLLNHRTAGIPPLDTLNERATAFRPARGLLLWRDHNISQRVLK
jgi:hypothetical protein